MELQPTPASRDAGTTASRIGWPGFVLIVAFWTVFGVLMLPQTGNATPTAQVIFTLLGAFVWAALTVPLLRLTQRFNLTKDEGSWRPMRAVALAASGMVFALIVSSSLAFASALLLRNALGGPLAGPRGAWVMLEYRLAFDILACYLVLAAGVARDYFLRYRSRLAEATLLRTQLAEARLEVLRTQLNPHFLFNTLNAVAALVQEDPRGVRRMIALLSDLLRDTLDGGSEPEVPLARELELLRRYLEIMEIRFRGTLGTRVAVDADILDALVPRLVLQPLVENAFKHGVAGASPSGRVEITAFRREADLVLTVRDTGRTGPGPSTGAPPSEGARVGTTSPEGGFGLRHTRERLLALYGEGAALGMRSLPEGGTVAEIRLPYRAAERAFVQTSRSVPDRAGARVAPGAASS